MPPGLWRAGRLKAPDRLLVLLAVGAGEAAALRESWVGQAIDVQQSADLAAALVLVGQAAPDVVVIAGSDPRFGPAHFLQALRQVDRQTPVIVGVLRPELRPEVLAAGATVVLPLPFSSSDLLRVISSSVRADRSFEVQPLPIDLGRLRVQGATPRIWVDGVEEVLPPMEFLLLRYLAERHREIISRAELVAAAWQERTSAASNSLSVHMTRLRHRLHENAGEQWIRSVRGFGYQLVVPAALSDSVGDG